MADNKKKGKNSGLTVACIFLAILVILIFFLVKKDTIVQNLKDTRFFERIFGKTPEFVQNFESAEKTEVPMEEEGTVTIKVETEKASDYSPVEIVITPKSENSESSGTENQAEEKTTTHAEQAKTEESKAENRTETKTENKTQTTPKETVTTTTSVTYTELQLCFVEVDSDGSVNRKIIKRSIPKNDSPLTTAINLLLEGPDTTKAAEKNCMSLIPEGTRLLSARVQNGIAYLNFNDRFEFNSVGVEGTIAQLMQIVYTATNFSTVNSVQFLIEGEKKDYLGSEGQWIGSPLSRNSF